MVCGVQCVAWCNDKGVVPPIGHSVHVYNLRRWGNDKGAVLNSVAVWSFVLVL